MKTEELIEHLGRVATDLSETVRKLKANEKGRISFYIPDGKCTKATHNESECALDECLDELRKFCDEFQIFPFANINGIFLKRENESMGRREHFSYEEAKVLFSNKETRIPTKREWKKMLEVGFTWDKKKRGIWIGKDHKDKKESRYSTFLPANGCLYLGDILPCHVGDMGSYHACTHKEHAFFIGRNVFDFAPTCGSNRRSVRCIKII
jgi:hypothetical protein